MALGGRHRKEGCRNVIIPRHASAVGVHPAQPVLRLGTPEARRAAIQICRVAEIAGNAFGMFIPRRDLNQSKRFVRLGNCFRSIMAEM